MFIPKSIKRKNVWLKHTRHACASEKLIPGPIMLIFENETVNHLPNKYSSKEELIRSIAIVHGELLFIHPFRKGNGRTARILANLMAYKQGYDAPLFERITHDNFDVYIKAIQKSAEKDYLPMTEFIRSIFPG